MVTGPGTGQPVVRRLGAALGREREAYDPGGDRPIGGYVAVMATYIGGISALTAAVRRSGRPLPAPGPWDVLLTAGAVHRLSRVLAKDPVTSPFRLPFTRFRGQAGPAELEEDVRGAGVRRAVGELVTCPFCVGLWVATAVTGAQVFAPEATRLACSGLTALTVADLLHFARAGLQEHVD
jgi:hypothetical protein